jgi:hypothetical protein
VKEQPIHTYKGVQMINEEEVLHLFIQSISQQIESMENTDVDIASIDELKLLLSDNLADDGMVHVRKSLMNKTFHLSFANYKDFLNKYEKGHMHN